MWDTDPYVSHPLILPPRPPRKVLSVVLDFRFWVLVEIVEIVGWALFAGGANMNRFEVNARQPKSTLPRAEIVEGGQQYIRFTSPFSI
jgi:hypothetical protein